MTNQVYLNGKLVDSSEVDPDKHRFVGVFRPTVHDFKDKIITSCFCGERITWLEFAEHYTAGHWDKAIWVDKQSNGEAGMIGGVAYG